MASLFELFDPKLQPAIPRIQGDAIERLQENLDATRAEAEAVAQTGKLQSTVLSRHGQRMMKSHSERARRLMQAGQALIEGLTHFQAQGRLATALQEYQRDAAERAVLRVCFKRGMLGP